MNLKTLRTRPALEEQSDDELVALYRQTGNKRVLGILFKRYSHLVLGICFSILKNRPDAEDAASEVFVSLFNKLDSYEINHFRSWLYMVTRNHCLKMLRNKFQVVHHEDISDMNQDFFMEFESESDHNIEERLEELSDAIDNLNEDQRRCIILFYLEEKTYKDIVEETDYDSNQVKSHIQNGRRNLKNSLVKTT